MLSPGIKERDERTEGSETGPSKRAQFRAGLEPSLPSFGGRVIRYSTASLDDAGPVVILSRWALSDD